MNTEKKFVDFIGNTTFADVPAADRKVVKNQLLALFGASIAGGSAEGCAAVVALAKEIGGKPEASIMIYGGKVPAGQAAFVNGVIGRALDIDDHCSPGAHIGSAVIPAALAAAELKGGCSGADFLTAVAIGTEVAIRLNLHDEDYDGFDPTGVCAVFGSTAAAAKTLGLSDEETLNALALAFNKCGASFQSNVDGALAVRVIEGWTAENGVTCCRLASRGITGPKNFLEGVYGYFHLFGRDRVSGEQMTEEMGKSFSLSKVGFKKYPSCGLTQASTEVILNIIRNEGIGAADIAHVTVNVPPYAYKLVGHPFEIGHNPKVNAQFSIRYCVASALVRKAAKLIHFEPEAIKDPTVLALTQKVDVIADDTMQARPHYAVDMRVITKSGKEYSGSLDACPATSSMPLTAEEHVQSFRERVEFATKAHPQEKTEALIKVLGELESRKDVREIFPLLSVD